LGRRIDNYDTLEKQVEQSREESERVKKQTNGSIVNLRLQQTQGVDAASKLNRQLFDSDEKIANLFGRSDASNDFKKIMNAVFAGLVALVIIGFFVIAFRDESVRKAIFSNESGIQFITLRSRHCNHIIRDRTGFRGKRTGCAFGRSVGVYTGARNRKASVTSSCVDVVIISAAALKLP
jgi:hypothetical protein